MKYDRTRRDLSEVPERTLKELLARYARRMNLSPDQFTQAKAEACAAELGFRKTIGDIFEDAEDIATEKKTTIIFGE